MSEALTADEKKLQQDLAWAWHSDPSLQLVYKTFAAFVRARTKNDPQRG